MVAAIAADPNLLTAVVFTLALAVIGVTAVALLPDTGERRLHKRIARVTDRRGGFGDHGEAVRIESVRRKDSVNRLSGLNRHLRQLLPNSNRLRSRIEQAGWRISLLEYLGGGAALGVAVALVLALHYGAPWLLALLVSVVVGVGVPHLLLQRSIRRRLRKFILNLPDAIDLIVRGVKSGLPVTEAINAIGQEMEDPIGYEFRQVSAQLQIGVELDEALWSTARRLDIQEFKFFVISLSIQRETGGNLAEVLENLSALIRRREQVNLKIKAMSSEARASAMIVGSLPFIMAVLIYLVNHDYIMQLFTDPRGWLLVGIGLTSLLLGVLVMAKMIRFEI
jgi:tight adherence protein B